MHRFAAAGCTGPYGLSNVNLGIYDTAVSLDETVQNMGFEGFSIKDYKVRFYDGKQDYVVQKDDKGVTSVTKEDVVLDAAETVSQGMEGNAEQAMAFTKNSYSENSHIATIWHEAFHAWQYTNWKTDINALMRRVNLAEGGSREDVIVEEVDSNSKMVNSFEQEMELLFQAYETENIDEKRSWSRRLWP